MQQRTGVVPMVVLTAVVCGLAAADDWAQLGGPTRDGVWREKGIVQELPEELKVVWETPVAMGYSGPAVADGKVYVMEFGPPEPGAPHGVERTRCLDAETGELLWSDGYACEYKIGYPHGPRATPTVDGERVYTLGAMGELRCLNTATGELLWRKHYADDLGAKVPTWGVAAAPLVDGERLFLVVGGRPGAAVVALDKRSGEELWRALEVDTAGYCPPIVISAGGRRQLIAWLPNALCSLDPETGQLFWREPFEVRMAMSIATPVYDPVRGLLFVSAFYDGPLMMRLSEDRPEAEVLWRGSSTNETKPDGLHALMSTPHLVDGFLYGVCSYGHLRCLDAMTGEQKWETLEATGEARWSNAFLVRNGDRFFIANEHGELILARLTGDGYDEVSRVPLIEPTNRGAGRPVVWSPSAFASGRIYARNDERLICVELRAKGQ